MNEKKIKYPRADPNTIPYTQKPFDKYCMRFKSGISQDLIINKQK